MQSLHQLLSKIKVTFRDSKDELLVSFIIIVVGISCFLLGKASVLEPINIPIGFDFSNVSAISAPSISKDSISDNKSEFLNSTGKIVASKNGTKYYFSHCGGVSRILDKNKVYFDSEEKAKQAGYTLASNCK